MTEFGTSGLPLEERFALWVDRLIITESDCALWPKPYNNGYAVAVVNGKKLGMHRLFYERFVGPIAETLQVHHVCHQKHCLNPKHMRLLTPTDHRRVHYPERAPLRQPRTHCKHGHPFYVSRSGRKRCATCNRLSYLRHRRANERDAALKQDGEASKAAKGTGS